MGAFRSFVALLPKRFSPKGPPAMQVHLGSVLGEGETFLNASLCMVSLLLEPVTSHLLAPTLDLMASKRTISCSVQCQSQPPDQRARQRCLPQWAPKRAFLSELKSLLLRELMMW